MAASIRVGRIEATIEGYRWRSTDATLAALLNAMLPEYGPPPYHVPADYVAALQAIEQLGGEVIRYDDAPKPEPGLII